MKAERKPVKKWREPAEPKCNVFFRVDPATHSRLQAAVDADGVTLTDFLVRIVSSALNARSQDRQCA